MKHEWRLTEETATDVVFGCRRCKQLCGFNKPGLGEPAVLKGASGWEPHPEIDKYVSPCEVPG